MGHVRRSPRGAAAVAVAAVVAGLASLSSAPALNLPGPAAVADAPTASPPSAAAPPAPATPAPTTTALATGFAPAPATVPAPAPAPTTAALAPAPALAETTTTVLAAIPGSQVDVTVNVSGPADGAAGTSFTYVATVGNNALPDADGATFTIVAPGGATDLSAGCAASGGGACPPTLSVSGGQVRGTATALPHKGQLTITVTGRYAAPSASSVTCQGTVVAPPGTTDTDLGSNTSTVGTAVTSATSVKVTQTQTTTSMTPGTPNTYTLTWTNDGPASADGTTTFAMMSFRTELFPTANISGFTCTATGGLVCPTPATSVSGYYGVVFSVTQATFPAGATMTVTYTADLVPAAPQACGVAENVVGADVRATVPYGFTNTGTSDLFVYADAPGTADCPTTDLTVTMTQSQSTIAPGSPVTYTVTYSNLGPAAADGASLLDLIYFATPVQSLSVHFLPCVATGGATCPSLSDMTIAISGAAAIHTTAPTLPAGGVITITYTVEPSVSATPACSASGGSPLESYTWIRPPTGVSEVGPAPNQDSAYTSAPAPPTCPRAALTATQTVDKPSFFPGEPTTYTVTYTNNGPDAADGATIFSYLQLFQAPFIAEAAVTIVSCTGTGGASCPSFVTDRTISGAPFLWSGSVGLFPSGATLTIVAAISPTAGGTTCPAAPAAVPSYATISLPAGTAGSNGYADNVVTAACADIAVNTSISQSSVQPGDPVTYTVKVSNASPGAARSVRFSNPLPRGFTFGSVTCTPSSATSTCTTPSYDAGSRTLSALIPVVGPDQGYVTFTITGTAGPVGGTYSATATATTSATGTDQFFDPVGASNTSTAVLTIYSTASTVTVTKALTGLPAGGIPAALTFTGSITCDYEGTKPWAVTVPAGAAGASASPVAFYDGQQCEITEDTPPSLPAGYTWLGGQIEPATLAVTGPSSTYAVTVTNQVTPNAVLQLATTVSRTQATVGQQVTFTYQVTNGGPIPVTDPVIHQTSFSGSDPLVATCPTGPVAPATSVSCTATYTVTTDDLATGLLTNAAYATATPQAGPEPTTTAATASIRLVQAPALSLTRSASPTTVSAPGQQVTYTYTVTNTGGLPLTNPVITESRFTGTGTAPAPTCPTALEVGTSVTCSATYTTTQADIDAGTIDSTAIAGAYAPAGFTDPTSRPADASVTAAQSPAVTLDKSAFPASRLLPGAVVTYSFVVTNAGNVTLSAVRIDETDFTGDGPLAQVTCPAEDVAPGHQLVCSVDYTVTEADAAAGTVSNTASAVGTPPVGPDVRSRAGTTVLPDTAAPALALVKTATSAPVRQTGDRIGYTFAVTNTGNVPVEALRIDEVAFSGTGTAPAPDCPAGRLLPGQTVTCQATYVVTGPDLGTAAVTNTATATALAPDGSSPVSRPSTASVEVEPGAPGLTLTKSVSPATITSAGQAVTFTIEATNTGHTPLEGVVVTDVGFTGSGRLGALTCPSTTTLAIGEHLTCTATYTATQADVDGGGLGNLARVVAYVPGDDAKTPVSDDADTQTAAAPTAALTLTKSASPTSPDAFRPGVPVTYTFVVTNTGAVTLNDTTVVEGTFDGTGTLSPPSCPSDAGPLPPGGQLTCTATYTLTQADIDRGTVTNSAQAVANPPTGPPVHSPDATTTLPAPPAPAVSLVKHVSPAVVHRPGDVVTYTFDVTNTGNVTLRAVAIAETGFGGAGTVPSAWCPAATVAPGQTLTCTAGYVVGDADLNRTTIDNTATASALYQPPAVRPFVPTTWPLADAGLAPPVVLLAPLADVHATSLPSSARVEVDPAAPPGPVPTRPAGKVPGLLSSTGSDAAEIAVAASLVLLAGGLVTLVAARRREAR